MGPDTHYKHSGTAPIGGILTTLVIGVIAAVVLGGIYGFLIYWSPLVYINFFITLGFGIVLGVAVGGAAKMGKIRSTGVVWMLALPIALLGYYIHWVVWVGRLTETYSADPNAIWTFVQFVNAMGVWSISDWTPTGFMLWAIWGIEAVMIVGIGVLSAPGITDLPFCETTGQWTTESALPNNFAPVPDSADLNTPSGVLAALQPATGDTKDHTMVTVASADGSDLRCVSLESVVVTTNKEGKDETEKTNLVKHMLLDRDSFDRLMKMGELAPAES